MHQKPPQKQRPNPPQQHHQQQQWQRHEQTYLHDVQTFLAWEAPGRPFRERSREYFINGLLIMAAVEIILFLFSQYLLMMVVLSLVFFSFALASVPPRPFHYRISSEGIQIEKNFFIWEELYDFYFYKHHGKETLHITTQDFFPGELTITLGEITPAEIKSTLLPFLPFREHVEPSWLEKAGDWLEHNFPLERNAR